MEMLWKVLKFLLWRKQVLIPLGFLWLGYELVSCATVYVGPAQVGVRQVIYGSNSGIHKQPLPTGTHFVVPGYERVHTFPTDLQSLDMSMQNERTRHEHGRTTEAIHIQTSDGYQVMVDATVLYRITDPYLVITKVGPGKLFEDSVIIPRSDQALRMAFGELNSEQFYQGPKRLQQTKSAFEKLQPELAQKGIELVKVLIRSIRYDEAYQHQIEQRKIQDQVVFKNHAEQSAAKEDAHKRQVISMGQANVRVELERGKREVAQTLADANLYRRQRDAEGDLLVKTAQAQGTEMENRALEGAGAQSMVGQRLAEVLKGIRVVVIPSSGQGGTNPLNIGDLLRQFEVGK